MNGDICSHNCHIEVSNYIVKISVDQRCKAVNDAQEEDRGYFIENF